MGDAPEGQSRVPGFGLFSLVFAEFMVLNVVSRTEISWFKIFVFLQ